MNYLTAIAHVAVAVVADQVVTVVLVAIVAVVVALVVLVGGGAGLGAQAAGMFSSSICVSLKQVM